MIRESYNVNVINKGLSVELGRKPPPGERKLYLCVSGPTDVAVRKAKKEMLRVLEEETLRLGASVERSAYGKFSVV